MFTALSRPAVAVGVFVLFHIMLWTIVSTLAHPTVHYDMVEQVTQGKQFSYSAYRHPPLSFWLPSVFFSFLPTSNLLYNLLAQLNLGFAFLGLWLLAKRLLPQKTALIAVLLVATMPLYFLHSAKLNANSIQIAVWVWAVYCAWQATQTNKNRYWVGLGVFAALALLGKYFAITMLLGMSGFFLLTRQGRTYLLTYKPYLALAVFIALVAPHFYDWFNQEASYHAIARAHSPEPHQGRLDVVKFFFTSAYTYNIIALLVIMMLIKRHVFFKLLPLDMLRKPSAADNAQQFLWWCACAPWLLASGVAFVFDFHISSLWSIPYWMILPLYLLYGESIKRTLSVQKTLVYACLWYLFIASVLLMAASQKPTSDDYNLPAVAAAQQLERAWHSEHTEPPEWIAGGRFAEFVALYIFNGTLDYNSQQPQHSSGMIICETQDTLCQAQHLAQDKPIYTLILPTKRSIFFTTRAATLAYTFKPSE